MPNASENLTPITATNEAKKRFYSVVGLGHRKDICSNEPATLSTWQIMRKQYFNDSGPLVPLHEHITSSTKIEVHNVICRAHLSYFRFQHTRKFTRDITVVIQFRLFCKRLRVVSITNHTHTCMPSTCYRVSG